MHHLTNILAPILPFSAEEFHQQVFRGSLYDERYHLAAFHLDAGLLGAYRELFDLAAKVESIDRRGKKCALHFCSEGEEPRRPLADLGLEDAKRLMRVEAILYHHSVDRSSETRVPNIVGSVRFKKCAVRLSDCNAN